jgi:hypothetical protein
VAVAPNGRTVAVWQGFSGITSTGVQASVLTPGGTWSAPVTVAPAGSRPQVAVDAAGDAVALWTTSATSVQAAILRAGGTWSAMVAYAGGAVTSPPGQGFGTPVNVAPSRSITQLTAAAGHALAVWTQGSNLTAATEPVT